MGFGYDEPWNVGDVLAFGRLASVDINWGRWLSTFTYGGQLGYEDFIARLWAFGDAGIPSYGPEMPTELSVLTDIGRSGSNAFVVSGDRSASGGALVASDPHLGLPQPNIWCIVGYRSPGRAAVGLTCPGLPFVLVGRNETVAWTGTNMQASTSVLYRLPEGWDPVSTRTEPIGVRFWFDREAEIRESRWGPVISDAALFSEARATSRCAGGVMIRATRARRSSAPAKPGTSTGSVRPSPPSPPAGRTCSTATRPATSGR